MTIFLCRKNVFVIEGTDVSNLRAINRFLNLRILHQEPYFCYLVGKARPNYFVIVFFGGQCLKFNFYSNNRRISHNCMCQLASLDHQNLFEFFVLHVCESGCFTERL